MNNLRSLFLSVAAGLAIFVLCATAAPGAGELKTFSKVVSTPEEKFTVEVSGTIDPENVEIKIENLGETPVVDPRISVNGLYDWYDINSMVEEITRDCTNDEEKALAIWQWVHWKRFQRSPHDESALQPVRALNGYGYGICGHTASWIKGLCRTAGLKARVWEIAGHTVTEVYYNEGWHMLDGNVKVFYLARDNHTIASLAELEKNGWLIQRTIHPRDPWVRQDDPPGRNAEFVHYLTTERDNWESDGYDYQNKRDYKMAYTLKPGETLTRWWEPVLGEFESPDKDPLIPQRYANGQLIWEPDLAKIEMKDYIDIIENVTTRGQDGRDPAIHIQYLQDRDYNRPSRVSLPLQSPYPIVGGRFWTRLLKEDEDRGMAGVYFGHPGEDADNLYTFRWGKGTEQVELDLDPSILKSEPCYRYEIGFILKGSAQNNTQAGVDWFKSVTDLQVSPHSLPALSLGKNLIRYRDSSPGAKSVRLTWTWRERNDNHPPSAVTEAVSAAEFSTLKPTLQWRPAKDADNGDKVADYQVQVSLRPDCRWPVSMALYRSLGSDTCEWTLPESFLNPGTTYYWRVRARDSRGVVGEWGKVFSFRTSSGAS